MGELSVGQAVTEGFRLIRARPGSVLAWGAVRAAFSVAIGGLMAPFYISRLGDLLARAKGATPSPPDLSTVMAMQGTNLLVSVVGLFAGAVLSCAVFRAVLAPDEGRWAYMRLGSAELFLFLLSFGVGLAVFVAIIVCAIPIGIVVAILAAVHAKAAAFLIAAAAVIAVIAIFIFALCRISLAGPMMVADGKFHLTDAWSLTKGKAGDLFLIGFGVFLIIILIEIMMAAFAFAIALAVLGANFQGAMALFSRPVGEIMTALAPTLAIVVLLSIPVFGCLYAIIAAPWARAWRDLAGGAGAAA